MYYKEAIRKEITPSRLKSLLKLVSRDYYTERELRELLQPSSLNKSSFSDFKLVFNFALNSKLIVKEYNGFVRLNISKDKVFDDYKFKKIMKDILMGNEDCLFYKITSWILKQDIDIIKFNKKEDLIFGMLRDGISVTGEDMLAWRFWFKYLGYGYNLKNEFIIPNPYKRINYLIEKELKFNHESNLPFRDFIDELVKKSSEFNDSINNNHLSYSLSQALRMLDLQHKVKLECMVDASDIWYLDKMEYQNKNQVTHIVIRR